MKEKSTESGSFRGVTILTIVLLIVSLTTLMWYRNRSFSDPLSSGIVGPQMLVLCKDNCFAISTSEISLALFRHFVIETGYTPRSEKTKQCFRYDVYDDHNHVLGWVTSAKNWLINASGNESDPVVCIDLEDAEIFAEWISSETGRRYRLPSRVEMSIALREGDKNVLGMQNSTWEWTSSCSGTNQMSASSCFLMGGKLTSVTPSGTEPKVEVQEQKDFMADYIGFRLATSEVDI